MECSLKLESSLKVPLSVPGLLSQVLYAKWLCANTEGVLQNPMYNSLILKDGIFFLIIHLFIGLFCRGALATVVALFMEAGEGIKPSEFS